MVAEDVDAPQRDVRREIRMSQRVSHMSYLKDWLVRLRGSDLRARDWRLGRVLIGRLRCLRRQCRTSYPRLEHLIDMYYHNASWGRSSRILGGKPRKCLRARNSRRIVYVSMSISLGIDVSMDDTIQIIIIFILLRCRSL